PKTVITAPPARMPSTCVRPLDVVRAASAAARRLALRGDTGARPRAQIRLGELLHEHDAELHERLDPLHRARGGRAERRELFGEVAGADDDRPGGDRVLGVALVHVSAQDA